MNNFFKIIEEPEFIENETYIVGDMEHTTGRNLYTITVEITDPDYLDICDDFTEDDLVSEVLCSLSRAYKEQVDWILSGKLLSISYYEEYERD